MLFLETSRPHFPQALVSLVDGAIPPHAFSWFSRAPSDPKAMLHFEQAKERRSFAGSCILRTCMAKPPLDLHSLPHPSHLHLRGSSSTHTGFLSVGLCARCGPLYASLLQHLFPIQDGFSFRSRGFRVCLQRLQPTLNGCLRTPGVAHSQDVAYPFQCSLFDMPSKSFHLHLVPQVLHILALGLHHPERGPHRLDHTCL